MTMGRMAKNERKNTICPAGNWPAALMHVDMPTKIATDAILRAIPRRALPDIAEDDVNAGSFGKVAARQGRALERYGIIRSRPKRVAVFWIRVTRFKFLYLRISLSRNRFPLSADLL